MPPTAQDTTLPVQPDTADCLAMGRCGRYVVVGSLGAGGMGIVLAAVDPVLGRKVALKLLHPRRGLTASETAAQIELEAQAMARLSHPNVVTVFEVDRAGDQTFVAMELVEGSTLRGWLSQRARPWREIVDMFIAAGRGLAAAHAAGLVHRDFKPDNVLIGHDGRPRVSDFGLVCETAGPGDPPDEEVHPGVDAATRGSAAGTPAYMSPEQWAGRPVDARGDQFAFCVALWEALWGRPFSAPSLVELRDAIRSGALVEPSGGPRVPRRLHAALRRGLAVDPAARWPDMPALLEVLARAAHVRRRWTVASAAAMTAIVAAGAGLWIGLGASPAVDPCAGASALFAGVWDAPRKAAVHAAFAATGLDYADDTWRRVGSRIDDYARGWVDMANQTCRATRVDGRQSDTLMDLRMSCLEERRSMLGALADLWSHGMDAGMLEHAIDAAHGLPSLAECADGRALSERASLPADPVHAGMVRAARPKLDAVRALVLAHRWLEARPRAAAVRADADAAGWPQLRAEAALVEGEALSSLDDPSARPPLLDAARFAGEARDDHLAAQALTALVGNLANDHQQADRALEVAEIADGIVQRAGNGDKLRGNLLYARGQALLAGGKYDAARQAFLDARARLVAAFGADDLETLPPIGELARVAQAAGDYPGAIALGNEALTKTSAHVGPDHPYVASLLNNLGLVSDLAGDHDAAAEYYRRSLALKEKIGGPQTAWVAMTLNNLGNVESARGRRDEAQRLLERALAIREHVLGPEHRFVAATLGNLANVRRQQGRYLEALALLERALAIKTKADGPAHESITYTLSQLGDVFGARGDQATALDYYRRALALRDKALGTSHPQTRKAAINVAYALVRLHRCAEARPLLAAATTGATATAGAVPAGVTETLALGAECDLAEGAPARAVTSLSRVIALAANDAPVSRGQHRWVLARALWSLGHRADALAAAHQAEAELADSADGTIDRAAVRAWLAAHGG